MNLIAASLMVLFATGTVAAASSEQAEEIFLSTANRLVTEGELREEHDRLTAAWTDLVFSDGFRRQLQSRPDWQSQLAYATLMRYPLGPGSGSAQDPGAAAFETALEAAIHQVPGELAPRVLALSHCHETRAQAPEACTQRHAEALIAHDPENALGYLFLGALAVEQGDVALAQDWLRQAAEQPRLQWGIWSVAEVLFHVFAAAGTPAEDPLKQQAVARLELALGVLAHLDNLPHGTLNQPCQQANAEPLLAACLSAAKAFKLPGTEIMPMMLALAFEERAHRTYGDQKALHRVDLERRSMSVMQEYRGDVWQTLADTGEVGQFVRAWAENGELDTQTHEITRWAHQRAAARLDPGEGQVVADRPIAQARHANRLACLDQPFPPTAPDCVTRNMVEAEVYRLGEMLDERLSSGPFRASLAADPSPAAQIFLIMLTFRDEVKATDMHAPRPVAELVQRFPIDPLANRLAVDWCGEDALCQRDTGERLMTYEPEDPLGYLVAAQAELKLGNEAAALALMHRSAQGTRQRTGFSTFIGGFDPVLHRHLPLSPQEDPLGVAPMAFSVISVGYAAALASPYFRMYANCEKAQKEPKLSACVAATEALLVPGGDLIQALVGYKTAAMLYEQQGDTASAEAAVNSLAEIEALMEAMTERAADYSNDPAALRRHMTRVAAHGEVAALRADYSSSLPAPAQSQTTPP